MLIVANLKMNLVLEDILTYKDNLNGISSRHEIVVCPSFPFLSYFKNSNFKVGAQNIHYSLKGAFTGEVSASQLKSLDIDYCIVGHSERRKYFFEEDKIVREKVNQLLNNKIKPIICVGETKEEKEAGLTIEIISKQLKFALMDVSDYNSIVIAYEPVWAIGTGIIPSVFDISSVTDYIKKSYKGSKVLYGGSVDDTNIVNMSKIDTVDGVLIGSFSNNSVNLINLINKI